MNKTIIYSGISILILLFVITLSVINLKPHNHDFAKPLKTTPTETSVAVEKKPEVKLKPIIASTTKIDENGIRDHMKNYNLAKYPRSKTAFVCSAYGCKSMHNFEFDADLITYLRTLFNNVSSPSEERKAIKLAITKIEQVAGPATGTATDEPMMGFSGNGNPSQMDCVDEATNSTSYLIIMHRLGLINYHDINTPNWKGGLFKWTHYAAVITDRDTKVKWAIDSGVGKNGDPPLIIEFDKWYE